MRMCSRLALLVALAASTALAQAPRVLVVSYQGLGLEPEALERLADALRAEVVTKKWALSDVIESAKQQRAAVMCGEDAECLATLGQRSTAKWVLAFGVARIGSSTVVSALLVDAPTGQKHLSFLEKLPSLPADLNPLAWRVVETLFKDVPRTPVLVPDVPPPPPIVIQPVEPLHPLRPYAVTATVVTGVAGIGGGILGVMAMQSYARLPDVPLAERGPANAQQRTLNLGADVAIGLAVAAATTATILWVLDSSSGGKP